MKKTWIKTAVVCALLAATPVMARKPVEIPSVVENPVIGDLNADGLVDMEEAYALMQNPVLKRELFSRDVSEQKRFYLSLEKKVRLKLIRLSRCYGTLRWEYAVERAREKGLSAIDAERIALALRR